ncbi:pirin family protein [Dyadobacter sp. OTU695]|uniref:pirin family protein n=1 Tax=Dyadobacter sp. OTU695 TaxID=3043860 RepID=UPI00313DF617
MLTQTDAQIYLESLRGPFQTDGFRSFRTFNFEEYSAAGRQPFGTLEVLNDETLMPECSCKLRVEKFCQVILLPMVGAIELEEKGREPKFINSGEALFQLASPDKIYTITNPYPDEPINYLQIRVDDDQFLSIPMSLSGITAEFDLSKRNVLLPVRGYKGSSAHLFIGQYDGRAEGIFTSWNAGHHAFIFVIEGAFEVQNRLLEKRDGLALRNAERVEFEALSNGAILLVIDIGGQD